MAIRGNSSEPLLLSPDTSPKVTHQSAAEKNKGVSTEYAVFAGIGSWHSFYDAHRAALFSASMRPLAQAATQTVERTVRRIVLVVVPTGLGVEFLPRELLQSQGNVLPQLLGSLRIPSCKLVNPACDDCSSIFHFRRESTITIGFSRTNGLQQIKAAPRATLSAGSPRKHSRHLSGLNRI